MTEIAVISDLVETQVEDDEFLFLTLKKKVRVWYIKTKLPDGDFKYQRYATKPTSGYNHETQPSHSDMQDRQNIILDRVNALGRDGFHVGQKYISLFISGKIKELILSRKNQRSNPHQRPKPQQKTKHEEAAEVAATEEIDDSPLARLLRHHMQRNT